MLADIRARVSKRRKKVGGKRRSSGDGGGSPEREKRAADPCCRWPSLLYGKWMGEERGARWNLFKKVNGTKMETRGIKMNGTVEANAACM